MTDPALVQALRENTQAIRAMLSTGFIPIHEAASNIGKSEETMLSELDMLGIQYTKGRKGRGNCAKISRANYSFYQEQLGAANV